MRREVIDIIADADPDEISAGLVRSRLGLGPKKRMNDGRVRMVVYLPPAGGGRPRDTKRPATGADNPYGLDTGPSRI